MQIITRKQSNIIPVHALKAGETFSRNNEKDIFIKLKPTSYLLNSNLVGDSLNARKVLIANLMKGTCYFIPGEELVTLVIGNLLIDDERN